MRRASAKPSDHWEFELPWGKYRGRSLRWVYGNDTTYLTEFLARVNLKGQLAKAVGKAIDDGKPPPEKLGCVLAR